MQFLRTFTLLTVAFVPYLVQAAPVDTDRPSATQDFDFSDDEVIPDSYVVVLKDGVTHDQFESHQEWAMAKHTNRMHRRDDTSLTGPHTRYNLGKLYGYAGSFDNSTIEEIRASDDVDYVEEDKLMYAYDFIRQNNPPSWGLGRICSRHTTSADAQGNYVFDSSAGHGVNVYVLDTGININHEDFGGRAVWGYNIADSNNVDGQGHGTHVAGTIAGLLFGVAKKANIIAVKVLSDNGAGSTSKVISGIEWLLAHAQANNALHTSVVNMSLGGGYSAAMNRIVEVASHQGLTFVVAAGNDGKNAANYSPASSPNAITVGATQQGDIRAPYSNWGSVVDVFAPGSQITSTWIGSNSARNTLSGTSMASPHVAGLAAYLIAAEGLRGNAQLTARIKELAQPNIVRNPGQGTPNTFIWNGAP